MMPTQTAALFVDAYRELNARRLFWIVLGLSGLLAAAFALIGVNERGLTIAWWEVPIGALSLQMFPSRAFFYKQMFFLLGFEVWLSWGATILALISTAGIIPDFLASGTVELALARPIGRVRLFLTKYLTGLLFVLIQVSLFSGAAFLVIGVRGGSWEPAIFLAVPIITLFFSFLYAISALVGLVTRSTITALLLTILFWFCIFLFNVADALVLERRVAHDVAVRALESEHRALEMQPATEQAGQAPAPPSRADTLPERLDAARKDRDRWARWHGWAFAAKTILPKTGETLNLLERRLLSMQDMDQFGAALEAGTPVGRSSEIIHGARVSASLVGREVQKEIRSRTVGWILGTSLLFEAAILALAAAIFARRDF